MEDKDTITLNEKSLEVLVAKFIPTSQYFERSFDSLQRQIDGLRLGQEELKRDMDRRFDQVYAQQTELKRDMDKRFEQVDKRFEQVDQRFEQVDQRFEQINHKLDTIIERLDVKIDAGLRENRAMSIRLFSFAMVFSAISMTALLAKMANLF
jgi:chromosome segregation ATPase